MSHQPECIFKEYLTNCSGGSDLQDITEKRLSSIHEASKKRTDSLSSFLSGLTKEHLVAHRNCLSTYTSETHIQRYLKREFNSQNSSKELLSPKKQRRSVVAEFNWLQHCLFCAEKIVTSVLIQSIQIGGGNHLSVEHLIEGREN